MKTLFLITFIAFSTTLYAEAFDDQFWKDQLMANQAECERTDSVSNCEVELAYQVRALEQLNLEKYKKEKAKLEQLYKELLDQISLIVQQKKIDPFFEIKATYLKEKKQHQLITQSLVEHRLFKKLDQKKEGLSILFSRDILDDLQKLRGVYLSNSTVELLELSGFDPYNIVGERYFLDDEEYVLFYSHEAEKVGLIIPSKKINHLFRKQNSRQRLLTSPLNLPGILVFKQSIYKEDEEVGEIIFHGKGKILLEFSIDYLEKISEGK